MNSARSDPPVNAEVIVEAQGLSRTYGSGKAATRALVNATFSIHAGEFVVLRGASGSGKTTLLNLIGGLDRPDTGSVRIAGNDVTDAADEVWTALRRNFVGYIFQAFALIPHLSAAENIELPLRVLKTPVEERNKRVEELLGLVGLASHGKQRPSELSGGQQQRVGIARALANRPRLLIADEPTGQLDSVTGANIMELIVGLVDTQGVAAIVSTHDAQMAALAHRILDIRDGSVRPTAPGRHAAQ
jgi:putative ABC transport system ATP-binding protein